MKTLADLTIRGKRVFVRVDWNVPMNLENEIIDDFRIRRSLPTIRALRDAEPAHIVIASHLGKPVIRHGERFDRVVEGNQRLILEPVVARAAELLKLKRDHFPLVQIPNRPLPVYDLGSGLTVLENLRFAAGELDRDDEFARALIQESDVFVNEAFSECHRDVASLSLSPRFLPNAAGLELVDEVTRLTELIERAKPPVVMILGGAKVKEKALVIDRLLKSVDLFLLGGVMANTFLLAKGTDMKQSVVEPQRVDLAKDFLNRNPEKFVLPLDLVWERERILDIGDQTQAAFRRHLAKAGTIFWNGPLGWTESGRERFMHGSVAIAKALASSNATTIVAGGDTLALIDQLGLAKKMTFLSTGGGATLTYLAGGPMPGLLALADQ